MFATSLSFHSTGDSQAKSAQADETCGTHKQSCPGMREKEHGCHLGLIYAQQTCEDKYANDFVTADLTGRCWQYVEHVIDRIAEESHTKGDMITDGPECQHGKEGIEADSYKREYDGRYENSGLTRTSQQ